MAHESFEDEATAAYLNAHFVAVKVDREERPDVDAVYMEATQALTGHGGWPMTVFATPDGRAVLLRHLLPADPRHGMPSFRQLLASVAQTWRERRDEVLASRAADRRVRSPSGRRCRAGDAPPTADLLDAAVRSLRGSTTTRAAASAARPSSRRRWCSSCCCATMRAPATADALRDGRGRPARRWPAAASTTSSPAASRATRSTRPGSCRTSRRCCTTTPCCCASTCTGGGPPGRRWPGGSLWRRADWMLRELRTAEGGFASALDADTEGVEGRTYVWTPRSSSTCSVTRTAVGRRAARGHRRAARSSTARRRCSCCATPTTQPAGPTCAPGCSLPRATRAQPARDDKVVAAWNGLAIAALAETGALLDRPDLVDAAVTAADLLVRCTSATAGCAGCPGTAASGSRPACWRTTPTSRRGCSRCRRDRRRALAESRRRRCSTSCWRTSPTATAGSSTRPTTDRRGSARRPQDPTDNATPSGWSAAAGALLTYAALHRLRPAPRCR